MLNFILLITNLSELHYDQPGSLPILDYVTLRPSHHAILEFLVLLIKPKIERHKHFKTRFNYSLIRERNFCPPSLFHPIIQTATHKIKFLKTMERRKHPSHHILHLMSNCLYTWSLSGSMIKEEKREMPTTIPVLRTC